MERASQQAAEPATSTAPSSELGGLYVYCIGPPAEAGSLGAIGIEGSEVSVIACNRLSAAVHSRSAEPYDSQDAEVVAAWVMAHHRVVDAAREWFGTVIPLTFNTIIKGEPAKDARTNLLEWVESEYGRLKAKLEALEGKAEYSVQVFWDPQLVMKRMAQAVPEFRRLEEQIKAAPRGVAYMHRQKLEAMLKQKARAMVEVECTDLHSRVSRWVDEIQIEKPKRESGQIQMLMNLSCLVPQTQVHDLEAELHGACAKEGFSTQMVGPLPPYSFC